MKILDKTSFPKEIVQAEAKPQLLAQAVRVYLASQRQGTQSALTRAEVSRTRKKFQKQKGSGNARHGDKKAPIFVGGGVSFAPKPPPRLPLPLSPHTQKKKQPPPCFLSQENHHRKIGRGVASWGGGGFFFAFL